MSPRTGRPTDNPKAKPMTIRLDQKSTVIMEAYCKQKNVGKSEAVRDGLKKLESDLESDIKK